MLKRGMKQNEDLKKPEEVDIAKYLAHYESDFAYLTSVRDDNVDKGLKLQAVKSSITTFYSSVDRLTLVLGIRA